MTEKILTIDEFYKTETLTPAFVNNIKEFEEVVYEMVKIMNHIHGTNYSYRFWKIIVIDYVNYKLQKKKILSEKIVSGSQGLKTAVIQNLIYTVKSFQNSSSLQKINETLEKENNIAHGFHDVELIEKEVGKVIPSYFPIILKKGDVKKRERANKLAEQYNDFFYKNLILQLPKAFVEQFDYIYNLYPLVNPAKKTFHISFIVSEYVKIMVAKYVENGARLYFYQHGGGGGEIKDRSIFHDSSISDNYVTWGWKIDDTQIPGKAYRCHGFKKIYEGTNGEKEFDLALVYTLMDEEYKNIFRPITNYIISNLDFNKYKRVVARPRPVGRLGNIKSQLDFIKTDKVTIDSGRSKIASFVPTVELMVTFAYEWPQTVFSECLYVNHPIVCMVMKLDCTTIFKPYYDFFIEQKVFHETVESMVEHLNKANINEWWSEVIKNPKYKAFKYEFLREV